MADNTTQAIRALIEEAKRVADVWPDETANVAVHREALGYAKRLSLRLASALEAASKDTQRLDWLDRQNGADLFSPNDIASDTAVGWRWYGPHCRKEELAVRGDNVRDVIDLARAEPDTEEEDTDNG